MRKNRKTLSSLLIAGALLFLTAKCWTEEAQVSKETAPPESIKTAEEKSETQQEKPTEEKAQAKEAEPLPSKKQKETSVLKTQPAEEKLVGCVAPVKNLVKTYQKELDALQKLIEKWNGRLQSAMQRETLLSKEIRTIEIEYDKKKDSEDKREKKEAARLKGQLERLKKEQKSLKKEMLKQCKEFSAEIGEFGKGSFAAIAEQIRQIRQDLGESLKEE